MSELTLFFNRLFRKKFKFTLKENDKTIHDNPADHQKIECPICNSEIQPYWEPRYNGLRGKCGVCGTNWQES